MANIPFSFGGGSGVDIVDAYNNVIPTSDNIPIKSAQTYTPGTTNQTISSGYYLTGNQTIAGDSDLVAGNIRNGVTIFGVTGNIVDRYSGRTVTPWWNLAQ